MRLYSRVDLTGNVNMTEYAECGIFESIKREIAV